MSTLELVAPLAGWASRLDEVPDPAFAMLGDGVAIDPTSNELRAPCDGLVVSVHRARHACTLRAANGAEVLLHIGVDTVELGGEGFRTLVKGGERVRRGDPLITFDMDLLARRARSLHTVVVVMGDDHTVIDKVQDREVAAGDALLAIAGEGNAADRAEPLAGSTEQGEERARLLARHGLHARPAAALAREARRHAGAVTVACRGRAANGKSVAALMGLDARRGDELVITADGPGARRAAAELAGLVGAGLGEPAESAPTDGAPAASTPAASLDPYRAGEEIAIDGVAAAPGLAIGRAVRLADEAAPVARDGDGAAIERDRLAVALAALHRQIEAGIAAAAGEAGDILRVQLDLVDDPELAAAAERAIAAGRSAAWAWQSAIDEAAAALAELGNPLLAERTSDLDDLARRALALLDGRAGSRLPADLPADAILVAGDIGPSELAALPGRVAGLCTARGGPTSHVAILAAGLGVPAVVAAGDSILRVPDGAPLIVDGGRGQVRVFPGAESLRAGARAITARAARRERALAAAREPGRTADGARIGVLANLGRPGEAAGAIASGAEGCGLLRTEFLFLDRASAPGEEEQLAAYQAIADAMNGLPLVIRTLDAGGDKPLAYLRAEREANPALGMRGVRLSLARPDVLRAQVRAILRVRPAGACRILVPMIAELAELRAVRAVVEEERRALGVPGPISLGAMIEVPVAALLAGELAREADFLSIGTNDLTQYALAMDRVNPHVAPHLDSLHPGVLRLIAAAVDGARARGRPVTVCGGAAADACAAPLLIGLGVVALSTAPALVPDLKALLATLTLPRCAEVARRALELDSGHAVRALVLDTWPDLAAGQE
jgi:multiphosphoryl transfer protein